MNFADRDGRIGLDGAMVPRREARVHVLALSRSITGALDLADEEDCETIDDDQVDVLAWREHGDGLPDIVAWLQDYRRRGALA